MAISLKGKIVAILVTDGFEQSELEEPRRALDKAGAITEIVSPLTSKYVRGWKHKEWGDNFEIDISLADALTEDYDALVLPGGVMNPDALRKDAAAVKFVQSFFEAGKPVAAICHGPMILIDAEVLDGRKLTSYPSIKHDLVNAGARWVDEEVCVDNGLVTSRMPADIPAFNKKMIEEFNEGVHPQQAQLTEDALRSAHLM